MSTSHHPIAGRLERLVGGSAPLLATVMWLPLLDGIFPALVLAGGLDSLAGIVQIGLLIFGGSATLAVLLADGAGSRRESVRTVLLVGTPLIVVAALEAALAPTIDSLLDIVVFERFAALVILAVAAKTASARIGEYLPRPAVIIGFGLFASLQPGGATLALVSRPELVVRGGAAAAVGVGFALAVAITAPTLRRAVHLDRFRFGSAVALGLLPLTFVGIGPQLWEFAPLAVLGLTTLFALEPGPAQAGAAGQRPVDHPVDSPRADDHPSPTLGPATGRDSRSTSPGETPPGESRSSEPPISATDGGSSIDESHTHESEATRPRQ
jgi:hypothetical protein